MAKISESQEAYSAPIKVSLRKKKRRTLNIYSFTGIGLNKIYQHEKNKLIY